MFVFTGYAIDQSRVDVEEVDPNFMMATLILFLDRACWRGEWVRFFFGDDGMKILMVNNRHKSGQATKDLTHDKWQQRPRQWGCRHRTPKLHDDPARTTQTLVRLRKTG